MKFHRRTGVVGVAALALLGFSAAQASAHVTANAPDATQGGYSVITFRVPTESATASTTGLRVQLPTDTPFASVSVEAQPGWTFVVKKETLPTPIQTDDGPVTEAISEVDWTATGTGIAPGEFAEFRIQAGPLPKTPTVTFKAIQHYSDNTDVSWVEVAAPGAAEPDHPAPTIALAAAKSSDGASASPSAANAPTDSATDLGDYAKKSGVTTALILAAIALVLGAVGGALGLAAWRRTRP